MCLSSRKRQRDPDGEAVAAVGNAADAVLDSGMTDNPQAVPSGALAAQASAAAAPSTTGSLYVPPRQ
jgi:hypothetical protein